MFYLLGGEVVNATVARRARLPRRRRSPARSRRCRASRSTARSASTRRTRSSSRACSRRSRRRRAVARALTPQRSGGALSVSDVARRSTASSRSSRTTRVNYLVFKNGTVARAFLASAHHGTRRRSRREAVRARGPRRRAARVAVGRCRRRCRFRRRRRSCRRIATSRGTLVQRLSTTGATARRRSPSMRGRISLPRIRCSRRSRSPASRRRSRSPTRAELTAGVAAWIREVIWAAVDHDADAAGGAAARAHVGSPAHVPVGRALRPDAVESDVTRRGERRARCTSSAPPSATWGIFLFARSRSCKSVDAILAEDTRHTRHLLDRYEIADADRSPYHEHNEAKTTPRARRAARARRVARARVRRGNAAPLRSGLAARRGGGRAPAFAVVPVPGASALLAALVASGTRRSTGSPFSDSLHGRGLSAARTLDEIASLTHTAVLYESPNRLVGRRSASSSSAESGTGRRSVAREMTKQFEEVRRGTVSELRAYYEGARRRVASSCS